MNKDIVFIILLIFVISWNVVLSYLMVNYVNEINEVQHCSTLAPFEGNVIQSFGAFRLATYVFVLCMGIFTIIMNLMK